MSFFNRQNTTLIVLSFLFLILLGVAIYFLLFDKRYQSSVFYEITQNGQIHQVRGEPSGVTIEDVDESKQGDLFLGKVVKGFFHELNLSTGTLQLKNQFMGSSYLQLVEVNIDQIAQFSCWPEVVAGTGGAIETKSMEFYVEPSGQDIAMPGETHHDLGLLNDYLKKDHYLVVQLRNMFDAQRTNQVQKLILLGC